MRIKLAIWLLLVATLFLLLQSWGINAYLISIWREDSDPAHAPPSAEDIYWPHESANRSAILVHGLNFDAKAMSALGQEFRERNYAVFMPRLHGHRADLETSKTKFNHQRWLEQIELWPQLRGPVTCAGYSLGGLFLVTAALKNKIECDRFFLFAPALAIQTPRALVRFLEMFLPISFEVPTGIPEGYYHFKSLGLSTTYATYDLLEDFEREVVNASTRLAKVPGVVLIDDRDEIVDASEVKRIVKAYFPHWEMRALSIDNQDRNGYHLSVDKAHIGPDAWAQLIHSIEAE